MRSKILTLYVLLISVLLSSCIETNKKFEKLPPGIWRAVLKLDPGVDMVAVEEEVGTAMRNDGDLPFNFEVVYRQDDPSSFDLYIHNDTERIKVNDIVYGLDRKTAKDTIIVHFPVFDTYIKGLYEEGVIEGDWYVNYKEGYSIPFKAYHGRDYRFPQSKVTPIADLTGKWKTTFEPDTDDEYMAIGQFMQKGEKLTGTFKTETGDYRFLEGNIDGNKFYLSTFDGAHAFLFTGKVLENGTLIGTFRSGKHYTSSWIAERDETFSLGDAYNMTTTTSDEPFDFTFVSTEGDSVSLSDPRYDGKIKLVKIMGTWCPNCKDETVFLLDYLRKEEPQDVEVIAIGFERYKDENKSMEALRRFKEKWEIPYTVLLGGTSPSKAKASEVMPQLSGILSYPTLIYVDGNNMIRKIYTGFSGPATDEYQSFQEDFFATIEELRSEN